MDRSQARLRWRCRRGMKELDLLLSGWLERRWPQAGEAERAHFEHLLDQQDPVLVEWLLQGRRPADAGLAALVDDILRRRG